MDSYELWSSELAPSDGAGLVAPPAGDGWELIAALEVVPVVLLWRRSLVHTELTKVAGATGRVAAPEGAGSGEAASGGFVPPKSQRERMKIPKGVLD